MQAYPLLFADVELYLIFSLHDAVTERKFGGNLNSVGETV